MKKYNSKKKSINFDNKAQLKMLITKLYKAILNLDTKTLHEFSFEIYKELNSRDDFDSLDDLCIKYIILRDELIERGVDISCLI